MAGPAPARRYLGRRRRSAARARLAHGEAAAHTRQALQLLDPAEPDAARTRHDLLTALGNDLLRSGSADRGPRGRRPRRSPWPASSTTGECLAQAAAVWGSVTVWNWRPHGMVDDDMVALLEDLLAERAPPTTTATTARLLGTLGIELAFGPDDRGRAGRRSGPSRWPGGSVTRSCSAGR